MRCRVFAPGLAAALLVAQASFAQAPLGIESASFESGWIERERELRIRLDRAPETGDGRLAVLIGHLDVSDRVRLDGRELVYDPRLVPLESGEQEVVVYLVRPDGSWGELGRRPLRVLTRAGFEVAELRPRVDLSVESRVAEHHLDDTPDPERRLYVGGTLAGGVEARQVWRGLESNVRASIVGASFQEEALRYGEEGAGAPRVDLSDYTTGLSYGPAWLRLGHETYGSHRFLLDNVSNRGLHFGAKLHERVDVSGALVSGNRVVGWDHFVGFADPENRMLASVVGVDLVRDESATVRLEGTFLTGSVQPRTNFNYGEVLDRERSQGFGLRLLGEALAGRMRGELDFARSSFDNPQDSRLFVDGVIQPVGVERTTENAYFATANVELLRNRPVWGERTASVALFGSYERVAPQFKTLGAYTNSNHATPEVGLRAELGGAALELRHRRDRDNLDDLDDVLLTKSREYALTTLLPLPYLAGSYEHPLRWLPSLSHSFHFVHQFGDNAPDFASSGFAESSIPDQRNTLHQLGADWSIEQWTLGYRFFYSYQNNRQEGREKADFTEASHEVTVGWQALDELYLATSGGYAEQEARDPSTTARIWHAGFELDWRFHPDWSLASNFYRTQQETTGQGSRSHGTTIDARLTYTVALALPGLEPRTARAWVRFAREGNHLRDPTFDVDTRAGLWGVLLGMSVSLFP
jgi:hypothetical protein